jgi:Na+/proline symporter
MNLVLLTLFLYVAAQMFLGLWLSRRISTEDQYLVGGRSLGFTMTAFTVFATWFGAETCMGGAGRIYEGGLSATTAEPFGYAICLLLMGVVFAVPLWKRKLSTLADLFRQRFGTRVERIAVFVMAPTSVMWAAAQIRGFGHVLGASSQLDITVTTTIAAAVVIVYTAAGGLLADAYTDLIQGIVLILGLLTVLLLMLSRGDLAVLADLPAGHLRWTSSSGSLWTTAEAWAVPLFGSVLASETVTRTMAARSPQIARNASVAGGLIYLAVGIIPLVIGLAAVRLNPGIGDPEKVLVQTASNYLPGYFYVIFAGALVSAILSTVNSALLVAGSLVAHNLILSRRPDMDERSKVRINQLGVVCCGVIAYLLALGTDSVYDMVEEASSFGSAGIFVAVVFGLFTPFGGAASAAAALLLALISYAVAQYALGLDTPFLVSLVFSLAGYVLVAALEGLRGPGRRRAEAEDPSPLAAG